MQAVSSLQYRTAFEARGAKRWSEEGQIYWRKELWAICGVKRYTPDWEFERIIWALRQFLSMLFFNRSAASFQSFWSKLIAATQKSPALEKLSQACKTTSNYLIGKSKSFNNFISTKWKAFGSLLSNSYLKFKAKSSELKVKLKQSFKTTTEKLKKKSYSFSKKFRLLFHKKKTSSDPVKDDPEKKNNPPPNS